MPVRLHTLDGECSGYRSGHYLHYTIAAIAQALPACYGLEASADFQASITKQDYEQQGWVTEAEIKEHSKDTRNRNNS